MRLTDTISSLLLSIFLLFAFSVDLEAAPRGENVVEFCAMEMTHVEAGPTFSPSSQGQHSHPASAFLFEFETELEPDEEDGGNEDTVHLHADEVGSAFSQLLSHSISLNHTYTHHSPLYLLWEVFRL